MIVFWAFFSIAANSIDATQRQVAPQPGRPQDKPVFSSCHVRQGSSTAWWLPSVPAEPWSAWAGQHLPAFWDINLQGLLKDRHRDQSSARPHQSSSRCIALVIVLEHYWVVRQCGSLEPPEEGSIFLADHPPPVLGLIRIPLLWLQQREPLPQDSHLVLPTETPHVIVHRSCFLP